VSEVPVDLREGLERYRAVRRQLEGEILPLATSVDGRRFSYQASLHELRLQPGSYVVLEQGSERRLGQVVTLEVGLHQGPEVAAVVAGEAAHRAVLDPNSDFVRLGQLRPDANDAQTARYSEATRSLAVRQAGDELALLLAELEPVTQAAVLRLDPLADREEYAELVALTDGGEALSLERLEELEGEGKAGGSSGARGTSACTAGASGRAPSDARSCPSSDGTMCAAWWSTLDRWRKERSRRWRPRRCSASCGGGARSVGPS
jgi:hypothetical protein